MDENDSEKRIQQLEAKIASLEAKLRAAQLTIEQYKRQSYRDYRDGYDYLPYGDDDRDR